MQVVLHSETELELSELTIPGFDLASDTQDLAFSAIPMFVTSLALCAASVLISYADHLQTAFDQLRLRVTWGYEEDPRRIGEIEIDIVWPELPPSRRDAARHAAEQCTLHHTLAIPPRVKTEVRG